MDPAAARKRYLDFLFAQVREVRFPSLEQLNRIEACLPRERAGEYLDFLFEKLEEGRYPSIEMLNRIDGVSMRFDC